MTGSTNALTGSLDLSAVASGTLSGPGGAILGTARPVVTPMPCRRHRRVRQRHRWRQLWAGRACDQHLEYGLGQSDLHGGFGHGHLSWHVENVGDWNDDGYDDLAIGGYGYDTSTATPAGPLSSRRSRWASTVDIASADVTIEGSASYDYASTLTGRRHGRRRNR